MNNTKSTFAFIGAALLGLCAFIADMPGEISNQIPQLFPYQYRGYLSVVFLLAGYAVHHYGTSQRTATPSAPGGSGILSALLVFFIPAAFAMMFFTFAGCAALTPAQQASVTKIEADVAPIVLTYAQTGQINYAQTIPLALDSVAAFDPNIPVSSSQVQTAVVNAVSAFTNGSGKPTGQKIAAVIASQLPANATGAQANALIVQAGIGASNGAN